MLRRSTLVVVFLFVVLLGIALYLQRNPLPKAESGSPTSTPAPNFFSLGSATIVKVRIENAEGKVVELVKNGTDNWEINAPATEPADASKVDSALTQISSVKILSKLDPVPALSAMGLENPANKIVLGLDDNSELHIDVGIETPTKSGYYLRLNSGEPVIVSKYSIDTILGFLDNLPLPPTPQPTETLEPLPETPTQIAPVVSATATP